MIDNDRSASRVYAINQTDGSLKCDLSIGVTTDYYDTLSLRSDGKLVTRREQPSTASVVEILSTANGALLSSTTTDNNFPAFASELLTDSNNGVLVPNSVFNNHGSVDYFNSTLTPKWKLLQSGGDFRFSNIIQDESGYIYGSRFTGPVNGVTTDVFALVPWTIATATSTNHRTVNFTVTTTMAATNPLTGNDNQGQLVLDDGTKVALAYQSTDSSGVSTWTATYTYPSSAKPKGVHTYTVELGQSNVQTDVVTHFVSAPAETNNTGLTLVDSYDITDNGQSVFHQ